MDPSENALLQARAFGQRQGEYSTGRSPGENRIIEPPFRGPMPLMLYFFLNNSCYSLPFGDYLKEYVYKKAGFLQPFDQIPAGRYRQFILESFHARKAPFSFSDTSVKPGKMIDTCIKAKHVSRETAFILGLGLGMTEKEMSAMLKYGLHEQDFSEREPLDVIIRWAISNGTSPMHAAELVRRFRNGNIPEEYDAADTDSTDLSTEEGMLRHVCFLAHDTENERFRTAEVFQGLLARSISLIRSLYDTDPLFPVDGKYREGIASSDIENVLYSGIPKNSMGNLASCTKCILGDAVLSYRLSRQRLCRILSGKAQIRRQDLLTLLFLVHSLTEYESISERRQAFMEEAAMLQSKISVFSLLPYHLYDAFLINCIRTEWPLDTFALVWQLSYRKAG